MAGTLQNQIKTKLNDNRLSSVPFSTGVEMGLITTSFTAWGDPTVGNGVLTDEAVFGGYARQAVSGWGASVLTGDGHAKSAAAAVGFSNVSGSDQIVAGWFLYDISGTPGVMMIGQFPANITIPDGETLPVAPYWTDTGE